MILFYEPENVLERLGSLEESYKRWKRRVLSNPRIDLQREFKLTKSDNRLHQLNQDNNVAFRYYYMEIDNICCDILVLLEIYTADFHGQQLQRQLGELRSTVTREGLEAWAKDELAKARPEREKDDSASRKNKEQLPAELLEWFNVGAWQTASAQDPLNLTVYETKQWRSDVRRDNNPTRLSEIYGILGSFYLEEHGSCGKVLQDGEFYQYQPDSGNWSFLCHYCVIPETDRRELTLLAIFDEESQTSTSKEEWAEDIKQRWLSPQDPTFFPCPKSYPGLLLDQAEAKSYYKVWLKIEQTDSSANLVMSGEEMEILKNLTAGGAMATADGAMPTFINGPAGSGKSTILHYLFVHFWNHKIENELPGDLLFITLSDTLLGQARTVVGDIHRLESECLRKTAVTDEERERLGNSFCAFREILKQIIEPDISAYPPENEIDFESFKELFSATSRAATRFPSCMLYQRQHRRGLTAELCWHIIRSYIKGYSVDGELLPDEFERLRQQGVFVSKDDYQTVFEEVWPWYKRITTVFDDPANRYWDQQDLARAVLTKLETTSVEEWPEAFRNVAVIFCDEAQDLTGVELKIVQHLSMLTRYDLQYQKMLPFAFAGDPLQSLNPSGFRWEDLRANMYRNLVQENNSNCAVGIQSLSLNYRSPREITYLANLIQLVRGEIFGESVQAQEPLSNEPGTYPMLFGFKRDQDLSSGDLKNLSGSIILLPCSPEHEKDIIEDYPILQKIKSHDPDQAFMSVMTAKGLDIQKVIVFAFGEELFSSAPLQLQPSEDIALAYAFNRVYVAVTRATRQLLIMDTSKGYENFWKVLTDGATRKNCLSHILDDEKREKWKSNLSELPLRPINSLGAIKDMDDKQLAQQASVLENDARGAQRADQMRCAANFYERAGDNDKARECFAYAAKYEENFDDAAKRFEECRLYAEAIDCLWKDERLWVKLCNHPSLPAGKRTVAKFLTAETVDFDSVHSLLEVSSCVDELEGRPKLILLNKLREFALHLASIEDNRQLDAVKLAECLKKNQYSVQDVQKALGHLWILLKDWENANALPPGSLQAQDKLLLQAHSKPWPEYIRACWELRNYGGTECFVARWPKDKFSSSCLDEEQKDMVIKMLSDADMKQEALKFAEIHRYAKAWELAEDLTSAMIFLKIVLNDPTSARDLTDRILKKVLGSLHQREDLRELLDLFAKTHENRLQNMSKDSKGDLDGALLGVCKGHLGWFEDEDDLIRAAAVFENIGLGKNLSELGETLVVNFKKSDLKNVAFRIYLRGRRITAEYEGGNNQLILSRIKEDSEKKSEKWGYSSEQFDLFWKDSDKRFRRPEYIPKGEFILEIRSAEGNSWEWLQSPLKGEIVETELTVHHEKNRRRCLFYMLKENRRKVYLADDTELVLKPGEVVFVPFNDNGCEVELTLNEEGTLCIRHQSWPHAYILPLSKCWD